MSSGMCWYAGVKPLYFKFTKDGVGVGPTLQLGDVTLSKDGATAVYIPLSELTVVDATNQLGVYKWTPAAGGAQTTCETLIINIKELSGTVFDENCIILQTGGNASAYWDAGL